MDRKPTLPGGLYRHPKTGVIWVRFRHRGVEYRRSTSERNPRAAGEAGRKIRTEIETTTAARIARRATLAELSLIDLSDTRDRGCTENHYKAQESLWGVVLGHFPQEPAIEDLGYEALRAYEGRRRAEGIRGQTISRELRAIKRAWKIAKRRGLVSELPADWPKITSNPPDKKKAGKLWPVEVVQAYLAKLHPDARDEIEFAALTGLRIAELKRVRADWVRPSPRGSAAPGVLSVPAEGSKTREARTVPLSAGAWGIAKRRIEALRDLSDPVFGEQDYKKHRRRICLDPKTGLGLSTVITPRDMRHTFASVLLQRTGDPVAAMRLLGHRDLRTTEIYLSTNQERLASATVAVGEVFSAHKAGSPSGITKNKRVRK